jgi:hypothetical protein
MTVLHDPIPGFQFGQLVLQEEDHRWSFRLKGGFNQGASGIEE